MIRKQIMKPALAAALVCCLFLAACDKLPYLSGASGGQAFRPLTPDVAAVAAPPNAPGQPLYCQAGLGTVHGKKGWVDFRTVDFVLEPGGRTPVRLRTKSGDALMLQGRFDAEGQKLVFCPVIDAPPGERIACSSIYALEDDLQMGIKRTFDVPDAVRGAAITCAYDSAKLKDL